MITQSSPFVSGVSHITKALTGYYPRQLRALCTHYARVSGLAPGHRGYVRFVILAQERTGSTYLQSLLDSHRAIRVFGEVFRSFDVIGWGITSYRSRVPRSELFAFQKDPIQFLETHVFAKFPKKTSAVGFKLFYTHAQHPRHRPLWTHLRNCKALRVIHLKRRNVLRTLLSLEKAQQMGVWYDPSGGPANQDISIRLDCDKCLQKFTTTRALEREHDALFADHDTIGLCYEELTQDYGRTMQRVLRFLGVGHEALVPATHKQAKQPLSAAISNYQDLKSEFKGTQWEVFFED